MLEEHRWEVHRGDIAMMFTTPGVVTWWRTTSPGVSGNASSRMRSAPHSPEFVALVEEILAEESDRET